MCKCESLMGCCFFCSRGGFWDGSVVGLERIDRVFILVPFGSGSSACLYHIVEIGFVDYQILVADFVVATLSVVVVRPGACDGEEVVDMSFRFLAKDASVEPV